MTCEKCGCKTMVEMPCGMSSYSGGVSFGEGITESKTDSYYQCVDCGQIKHLHSHYKARVKATPRHTKFGGVVIEYETLEVLINERSETISSGGFY